MPFADVEGALRDGIFLGIDHSAISVQNTTVSTDFLSNPGFYVTAEILESRRGAGESRWGAESEVEVTALSLDASTPHLELLCYRSAARPSGRRGRAMTWRRRA